MLGKSVAALSPAAWLVVDAPGEARGRVETVEPHTGIIRVSSGFLGMMSVALLVTPETLSSLATRKVASMTSARVSASSLPTRSAAAPWRRNASRCSRPP